MTRLVVENIKPDICFKK